MWYCNYDKDMYTRRFDNLEGIRHPKKYNPNHKWGNIPTQICYGIAITGIQDSSKYLKTRLLIQTLYEKNILNG